MSDFKTRLIEEKQQLDERKDKLQSFIDTSKFDELPEIQKCGYYIQLPTARFQAFSQNST